MKKAKKEPIFKVFKIKNSSWISNFWFFNDKLFLTESLFDEEQNFLGYLTVESLENNLGFKKPLSNFINHPNPLIESALQASLSEIKTLAYPDEFVYQVFKTAEKLYVGLIKQDKVHGLTKIYNQNLEEVKSIDDYLIFGNLNQQLLFTNVADRKLYVYENEQFKLAQIQKIKKVLNFKTFDLFLTMDNQIYQLQQNQQSLIYDGKNELEIAKLNEEVIIISDKAKQETFSFSLLNSANQNLIINEYFFHLEVVNNKILVGKPLFLDHRYEDYSLPLTFIL